MTESKVNQSNFKAMENRFSAVTFAEALERANEVENVRENNKRSMLTALFMVLANELQRLEMRMDEQLEGAVNEWLDAHLNEMLAHRMESFTKMLDANLEEELEEKIEEKVKEYLEENLDETISDKVDEWLDDNLEQQIDERAEAYAERHVDEWIEDSLDNKLEDRADDWIFYNLDEKLEDARDEWLERNLADTIDTRVGAWLNENLEREIKDRVSKYESSVAPDPAEQSATEPNMKIRRDMQPASEWDDEVICDIKLIAETLEDAEFATEYTHAVIKTDLIPQLATLMANNVAKQHGLMYYISYRTREKNPLEIHFHRPIEATNSNE